MDKKEVTTHEEKRLDEFEWEDGIEFFDEKVSLTDEEQENFKDELAAKKKSDDAAAKLDLEAEAEKEKEKVVEEEKSKPEEKKEEEKPTEEEEEFFDEKKPEEENSVDDDPEFFKNLATGLKEKGVFANVEIGEDDEVDEDTFISLQEKEIDSRVDETFEAFFEEMDDEGKAFLKFKKDGGDSRDFFSALSRSYEKPSGDIDDEAYQKSLLRYYHKNFEGMSDEDVDDRIEWLAEGGKLDKFAKNADKKIDTFNKQEEARIKEQAKARVKNAEKSKEDYEKKIKTTLGKVDKVGEFTITTADKSSLAGYLTKPAVKTGKNRYITQFQNDLRKTTANTETLILLAKLIKNGFDISDLKKEVTTKKTRSLKDTIQGQKKTVKVTNSGSTRRKSLSDFFGN